MRCTNYTSRTGDPSGPPERRALGLRSEVGDLVHDVQQDGWYPEQGDEIRGRASHDTYDMTGNRVDIATILGIDREPAFAEKAPLKREPRWRKASAGQRPLPPRTPSRTRTQVKRRVGWTWSIALGLLVLLSGCGKVASGPSGRESRVGTRSSLTPLGGYAVAAGDTLYRLSYECAGQAVEAYMTEPGARGHYPLLVNLHGGAAWNVNQSHDNFGFTAENAANAASSHFISLYPEYQGYLGSSGPVRGLSTDAKDTLCAIRAVASLPAVNSDRVYLLGTSIGGGVALKVASLLPTVRAVVVVSPWVGLRDELPWLQRHAQPYTIFGHELLGVTHTYGFSPNQAALAAQSPDLQAIKAPVLLLQGTADTHVPYQVVEQFYGQMKAAGKTVKLILYPGGHHGLHGSHQQAALAAMRHWFTQYGLNF